MKIFKRGLSVLLLSVLIVSAAACHNVDKNYGVKPVTLGANILRAQTAAACAVWALANL